MLTNAVPSSQERGIGNAEADAVRWRALSLERHSPAMIGKFPVSPSSSAILRTSRAPGAVARPPHAAVVGAHRNASVRSLTLRRPATDPDPCALLRHRCDDAYAGGFGAMRRSATLRARTAVTPAPAPP